MFSRGRSSYGRFGLSLSANWFIPHLSKLNFGLTYITGRRHFRTTTARQEELSLKEREEVLEKNVRREFLGQSSAANVTPKAYQENAFAEIEGEKHIPNVKKVVKPSMLSWVFLGYLLISVFIIQPKIELLSGVPWWTISPDLVAVWILFNFSLSSSEQKQIRADYQSHTATVPDTKFISFLEETRPILFKGAKVDQNEIIAALGACYAFSGDKEFIANIRKVSRAYSNQEERIDNLMDHLVRTYPSVFHQGM